MDFLIKISRIEVHIFYFLLDKLAFKKQKYVLLMYFHFPFSTLPYTFWIANLHFIFIVV